ncbi:MAG: DUF5947 family protein [Acidimicrobiales bacterium]
MADGSGDGPLAVLQRIRRPAPLPRPGERCEVCVTEIGDDHPHVVNLDQRTLLCACRACYLLFSHQGAAGGRYRAVPDRYVSISGFALDPGQWEALQLPVSVAFFFHNSDLDQMAAFYPSPAGATESLLPLGAWEDIAAAHPSLTGLEPDVEAALVRVQRGESECFVVPIDACYELVGHLRRLWRGFDGGREAHEQIEAFFARIRARSRPSLPGASHG